MMVSILLAIFVLTGMSYAESYSPYSGFRFVFQNESLEAGYAYSFDAGVKKTINAKWKDLTESIGTGFFSLGFSITNITCAKAGYDVAKRLKHSIRSANSRIIFEQEGEVIGYTFQFNWDFQLFGMHLFFGAGKASMATNNLMIELAFEDQKTAAFAIPVWKYPPSTEIQGASIFAAPISSWVARLFNATHYEAVSKLLSPAISEAATAGSSGYIHYKNPLLDDNKLDVLLENSYNEVKESPPGYITTSFITNITVENGPYNKKLWREINTSINLEKNNYKSCVANDLLVSLLEVTVKTRGFLIPVDPESIGMAGKANDLFLLMPKLAETWDSNAKLFIGCKSSGDDDIVMLNNSAGTNHEILLQIPGTCSFFLEGKEVFTTIFYARTELKRIGTITDTHVIITGELRNPQLYSYHTLFSAAPVETYDLVYDLNIRLTSLLKNFKVLGNGLKMHIPSGRKIELQFDGPEETCFAFA